MQKYINHSRVEHYGLSTERELHADGKNDRFCLWDKGLGIWMSKAVHNLLKVLCKQILKDPTKKPLMTFRDYSCRFVKRNKIPKSDTMFIPPLS